LQEPATLRGNASVYEAETPGGDVRAALPISPRERITGKVRSSPSLRPRGKGLVFGASWSFADAVLNSCSPPKHYFPAISCLGAFPTPVSERVAGLVHCRRPKTCTKAATRGGKRSNASKVPGTLALLTQRGRLCSRRCLHPQSSAIVRRKPGL